MDLQPYPGWRRNKHHRLPAFQKRIQRKINPEVVAYRCSSKVVYRSIKKNWPEGSRRWRVMAWTVTPSVSRASVLNVQRPPNSSKHFDEDFVAKFYSNLGIFFNLNMIRKPLSKCKAFYCIFLFTVLVGITTVWHEIFAGVYFADWRLFVFCGS